MKDSEFRDGILYLKSCMCTLSVFSSLIIIFFYIYLNQLKKSFTYLIIFNVALIDLFFWGLRLIESIYELISGETFTGALCLTVSFFSQVLPLSSFFWMAAMSFCIYNSIIHHRSDFSGLRANIFIFTYGLPLALSCLPFITKSYGAIENTGCWIKGDLDGSLHRLLIFYLPLLIVLLYSFWMVKRVWRALKIPEDDICRKKEIKRVRNQFLYYPLIFSFCYFVPLLRRVFELIDNIWNTGLRDDKTLLILHHTLGPLQGFFNALVYGICNRDVKNKITYFFCCCPNEQKENKKDIDSLSINLSAENSDSSRRLLNLEQVSKL